MKLSTLLVDCEPSVAAATTACPHAPEGNQKGTLLVSLEDLRPVMMQQQAKLELQTCRLFTNHARSA